MDDVLIHISIGAAIGIGVAIWLLKKIKSLKLKQRMKRARKGEIKAVSFLKKNGYDVLDMQREAYYTLEVDGRPHVAKVRADFIVKKGRKTFVAEVKTGSKATSPRNISTRRQLLEYFLVYRPHGIILVDMEKKRLRHIEYYFHNDTTSLIQKVSLGFLIFFAGLVIGFLTRGG